MHVPLLILLGAVSFLAADGRPLPVSAHNCYASNTTENPKLVQALALGIDNIEIDVGWDATSGSLIVGHDATPRPGVAYPDFARSLAPVLEEHFRRVPSGAAPTVLTVDFKTDRPEAVAVFRAFLDAHADWFSSAEKPANPDEVTPLTTRRLTVCLTGSDVAKGIYDASIPVGGTYRAFKDKVVGAGATWAEDVATLVPRRATAFHRFLAYHWSAVERGGLFAAADWSAADAARLESLARLAREAGFRVRVYCLNGHTGIALGGYRFRSDAEARARWLAAAAAGVDWVASDEYEELVAVLRDAPAPAALPDPIRKVVDLDRGESARVELANGVTVSVRLDEVIEPVDPLRGAVREPRVRLTIDGKSLELVSGNYRLPVTSGSAQVDCPIVGGYRANTTEDHWALAKAARIRLWPAGSSWIDPATFIYPARQRWLASMTQMANEPVHVDGGEIPANKKIYYHSGLDIGGAEGMVDVVCATDGIVASSGLKTIPGLDTKGEGSPVRPRYDVVYLRDERGWYYRYSHLASIDPAMVPGARVRMNQPLGVLGKEGGSGGWSHLHFEIKAMQPSGRWGTEEGYAYLWQAALAGQKPDVVAVARPHHFARVGDTVRLDGSRSWSRTGAPSLTWRLSDGATATTPQVERVYDAPGTYSEILEARAADGKISHDFAIVQIIDPKRPQDLPPTIHAAFAPTMGIVAGDPVTFKTRTFRVGLDGGHETWNFGDGTPEVQVRSDGNARQLDTNGYATHVHRFAKPGDYLVRVERVNKAGMKATARLRVRVD